MGLPSLTRVCTPVQFGRLTFVWIVIAALGGLVLAASAASEKHASWQTIFSLVMGASLVARAVWLFKTPDNPLLLRRAFHDINLFALASLTALCIGRI